MRRAGTTLAWMTVAVWALTVGCDGGGSGGSGAGDAGLLPEGPVQCSWLLPGAEAEVSATITLRASCAHSSGVRQVDFKVDGRRFERLQVRQPDDIYEVVYDTAELSDGLHTFTVSAQAVDGSLGSAPLALWLDNTPPELTVTQPVAGERFVGELPLALSGFDPPLPGRSQTQRPLRSLQIGVGNQRLLDLPELAPGEPLSHPLDVSAVLTGAHTLSVRALDAAGNVGLVEIPVRIVTAPNFRGAHPQDTGCGCSVSDLAVLDDNGDGVLDLAFLGAGGATLRLGDGQGGFLPPRLILDGGTGQRLLAADIDGDGRSELIRAGVTAVGPLLAVHQRNEYGWPGPAEQHTLLDRANALVLALVDSDEWPDLVVGGEQDETSLALLRGRDPALGPPWFEEPVYTGGVSKVRSLQVVDVDGDGHADVVVGQDAASFAVFPGRGDGSFGIAHQTGPADGCAEKARAVAVLDLTWDGVLDLVASQDNSLLLPYTGTGPGDWQFTAAEQLRPLVTSWGGEELLTEDLDGDGHLDLLVVNAGAKNLNIYFNRSPFGLTEGETYSLGPGPRRVQLADLDGDGVKDLVYLGGGAGGFVVQQGRGSGSFGGAPELRLPKKPAGLAVGRFDDRSRPDLLVVSSVFRHDDTDEQMYDVMLARNDGRWPRLAGNAGATYGIHGRGEVAAVALADVDADDHLDLLVATRTSCTEGNCPPSLDLVRGDGEGAFVERLELWLGSLAQSLQACDMDGDGHADVVVGVPGTGGAQPSPPQLSLGRFVPAEGDTPASMELLAALPLSGQPVHLACARFNSDAANDLLSVNTVDGSLNYYKGSTEPPYSQGERQVLALGEAPQRVAAADVDGDGQLDAVASIKDNIAIAYGAPGGEAFDSTAFLPHPLRSPMGVVVRDFTDDHLPDVAVVNSGGDTLSVYVNAGEREFIGPVDIHTGLGPTELVSADFNGDGCSDLATLNVRSWTVTLLLAEGARCEVAR